MSVFRSFTHFIDATEATPAPSVERPKCQIEEKKIKSNMRRPSTSYELSRGLRTAVPLRSRWLVNRTMWSSAAAHRAHGVLQPNVPLRRVVLRRRRSRIGIERLPVSLGPPLAPLVRDDDRWPVVGRPLSAPETAAAAQASLGEPSPAHDGEEDGETHGDDEGAKNNGIPSVQGECEAARRRNPSVKCVGVKWGRTYKKPFMMPRNRMSRPFHRWTFPSTDGRWVRR